MKVSQVVGFNKLKTPPMHYTNNNAIHKYANNSYRTNTNNPTQMFKYFMIEEFFEM